MGVTATLGLVKPTHGINVVEGNTPAGQPNEAANLDAIDAAIAALNGTGQGTFLVTAPAADQTVTNGHKIANTGGFQGPLTGDVTGNVSGNVQETLGATLTTAGAIAAKQGVVRIAGSAALAMSIADPTNGTDDGKRITIVATAAHAHVITVTGGLAGGAHNTVTLGGAVGDMVELEAIAGKWFLRPSINATATTV